jgi:hypothetical protein
MNRGRENVVQHTESVFINDVYVRTVTSEGAEKVPKTAIVQVASFTLVTDHFCRLPVLFIE